MCARNASLTRLGVGIYAISDAARILGVHPSRVRRWLKADDGLVTRYFDPAEQTLSFMELMELHFIKMFRDEGVSLQVIRKASRAAAKRFKAEYPFAVKRFDTDGKTVFATLIGEQDEQPVIEDLRRGQYVLENIMRPFFRKLDYDTSAEVSRFWPLDKSGRIVLDPQRSFGKPIDAETGVPTDAIFQAFKAGRGQNISSIAEWFDVPSQAVEAAISYEQSRAA